MDTSFWEYGQVEVLDIDHSNWVSPGEDFYYLLHKNGHIFVVQTPPSTYTIDEARKDTRIYRRKELQKKYLELVFSLLDTVQISNTKWLYLSPPENKSKSWRLLPKRKGGVMYQMRKAPIWLPRIQENELQLINYSGCCRSICKYKGEELAVDIAWDPETFKKMEKMMIVIKELSKLDLCFEPVAQVFRGEDLVGIASKPIRGRILQYTDRSLFYHAMSKLQDHRRKMRLYLLLYNLGDFYVHNGKFRVADNLWMFDIFEGSEVSEAEFARQDYTYRSLALFFNRLKGTLNQPYDTYWIGPSILIPILANQIRPVLTPTVKMNFVVKEMADALAAKPRTFGGVIRPKDLLPAEEQSAEGDSDVISSAITKSIDKRKVSPLSAASITIAKRHRSYFPTTKRLLLPAEVNFETDSDGNETLVSGDDIPSPSRRGQPPTTSKSSESVDIRECASSDGEDDTLSDSGGTLDDSSSAYAFSPIE